jgi:hypothetical protein
LGTLIRHARPPTPVFPLTVAMIEPSFRAPLVAAVGAAALPATGFGAASGTAVALSAIAVPADPEQRVATNASPLTKDRLAMKIHARRQAGLDNGDRSWQVRTSSMCGYLLKVARLGARPLPTTGHPHEFPPSTKNFTPFGRADDDRLVALMMTDGRLRLRRG